MSWKKETVGDIVRSMRESCPRKFCSSKSCRIEIEQPVREFASRIESAWLREKEELCECLKDALEHVEIRMNNECDDKEVVDACVKTIVRCRLVLNKEVAK